MSLFRQRADDRQRPGEQEKNKNIKKSKNGVCLIVFDGSSLSVLYGYFIKGVAKKQDGPSGVALLEALAGPFICFGESDVHP